MNIGWGLEYVNLWDVLRYDRKKLAWSLLDFKILLSMYCTYPASNF